MCTRHRLLLVSSVAIFLLPSACSPGRRAAVHLDRIAESVDKYGFASISSPFLATPTTEFAFDLDRKASDYYADAFVPQGGFRNYSAEALDVQLAFRMNIEQALATIAQYNRAKSISSVREAQRKAGVQKTLLEQLTQNNPGMGDNPLVKSVGGMLGVIEGQPEPNPEALPGFTASTTMPEYGAPIPTEDRIALAAVGGFTPGLEFPKADFRISAREALLIASGDIMTQSLFRWFMNPAGNKLDNYELFFCPVIVSVQPGYQTRQGFLADITVNIDLARHKEGGELEFLSEAYPHSAPPLQVAGVFPVIDSQVLNLANSRRQLFSLAMQLSLMGFGAEGDAFADYAKRLEQDAKTQSTLTVGSAYTIGSTAFGFRVEPKLVASKDPARIDTEPGKILDSKTFPAMAVLLVHRGLLKPADAEEECIDQTGGRSSYVPPSDSSAQRVLNQQQLDQRRGPECGGYDYLVFRTSTRWAPLDRGCIGSPPRYSEVEAWERAHELDMAEQWISGQHLNSSSRGVSNTKDVFWGPECAPSLRQVDQLSLRAINLRKLALDTQALMKIGHSAPKSCICVENVLPSHGWRDQYTVLTIRGSGFRGNVSLVTVGGIACNSYVADDRSLLVVVPPWDSEKKDAAKPARQLSELISQQVVQSVSVSKWASSKEPRLTLLQTYLNEAKRSELNELEKKEQLTPKEENRRSQLYMEALVNSEKEPQRVEPPSYAVAEVVISARVPVVWNGARDDCTSRPTSFDCGSCVGSVVFDKSIPKSEASESEKDDKGKKGDKGADKGGSVSITRTPDGRIAGVEIKGNFENGLKVLEAIREALPENGGFNLQLKAQGGMDLSASKPKAPTGNEGK